MLGLVPSIHGFRADTHVIADEKSWMAGTRPAMTVKEMRCPRFSAGVFVDARLAMTVWVSFACDLGLLDQPEQAVGGHRQLEDLDAERQMIRARVIGLRA